jgi:long-chain acyl-CoA synthetase
VGDEQFSFWAVAEADPARVALVEGDGTTTSFGALLAASRSVSRGLHALGLRRGDGVAVAIPNVRAFFECYLAAMESGLYFTPVNTHLSADEIEYVVGDSEAAAVIVHAQLGDTCRHAVEGSHVPPAARFAVPSGPGFRPYADLLSYGDEPLPDRSAGTTMMYTSGTTGRPKGVRRRLPDGDPESVFGAIAVVTCTGFGVPPGPGVHLVCGPMYHAGPNTAAVNALHVGHTIVLMDRWTPEGCLEAIERHRVTSTQMVPTMFHRLLSLPADVRAAHDVSSVTSVMHTGAPCPKDLKQRFMDWWGPVVYETYGGTEAVATIATPRRWLQSPGTVGKPIHGVTVRILDDDGTECPPGVAGTIYVESSRAAETEYFEDPQKTEAMRRGRAVTLGDIGYLDDDGYLFVCDRKIDMVISGGENIYPAEVEAAHLQHPAVADVAVIGVPDDEWGEQVKAIVELAPAWEPSSEVEHQLIEFCRGRIARFKCPRTVEFVDVLPRLPNGKIEKRRLREKYWRDHQRAI